MSPAIFLLVTVVVIAAVAVFSYEIRQTRRRNNPTQFYPKLFQIETGFDAHTLTGFRIGYRLTLECERINDAEFSTSHMHSRSAQLLLALGFRDSVLLSFLGERSCFFHLGWEQPRARGKVYDVFPVDICQVIQTNGHVAVREIPSHELARELKKIPFSAYGCAVRLVDFHTAPLSENLVNENYAMLSKEIKEAIQKDERYGAWEEMLAIAALKRRLEFIENQYRQKHDSEWVPIETEQAGRGVKIKWRFTDAAPPEYELIGYRKTGGFSPDNYGDDSNGMRVIQTHTTGEVVEFLSEGETYFYTFVLQPWKKGEKAYAIARFQITVETKTETDAIEAVLNRLEATKIAAPEKETLSRALKELGSYVEMDTAFDAMEKSFSDQIRDSDLPEEAKRRKIERLHDIVVQIRSKYEP
jgi:hypothetical protein